MHFNYAYYKGASNIMQYLEQIQWLTEKKPEMQAFLVEWAETNSGSLNLSGIQQMQTKIKKLYSGLNATIEQYALTPYEVMDEQGYISKQPVGDVLYIQQRAEAKYQILLCGHCDTVFAENHSFQQVTKLDDNTLKGPGVTDMKGGLLVMYYALLALENSPYKNQIGWRVFINADEEIGSLSSSKLLPKVTENIDLAFVYEPAMDDTGTLAGERKGSGIFTVCVKGKAAHVGRDFEQGKNAIVMLSKIIIQIHELNKQSDIIINVGKVSGGDALNKVADFAKVQINIRTGRLEDEEKVMNDLQKIIENSKHQDYQIMLDGHFHRKPKVLNKKTKALYDFVQTKATLLDLDLRVKATGGCCDGNNLSALGIPNIDTLGVRGGNIHTDKEYIKIDSLLERAQLSALLLMAISSGELELSK